MRILMLAPLAILLAASLATSAAAQRSQRAQEMQEMQENFGNSVRHNIAVQAGDMNPQYVGTEIEGGDGHRSSDAVTRYLEGRVIRPTGLTASGETLQQGSAATGTSTRPK